MVRQRSIEYDRAAHPYSYRIQVGRGRAGTAPTTGKTMAVLHNTEPSRPAVPRVAGHCEVYWRCGDLTCMLRCSEAGWEIAVVDREGQALEREGVTDARAARLMAAQWRRSSPRPAAGAR